MTKFITNQNIEINLEIAGLGNRIIAFLIDSMIIITYLFSMGIILGAASISFGVVHLIAWFPIMVYSLLFEVFANGQTPGKMQQNIKVVRIDGGAPSLGNYLLRWIIRPLDIFFYGAVAMLTIIMTKNGQRLGDLAAGTTVIRQRTKPSFKLSEVGRVNKDADYQVMFPQVKRLNDKQIDLIRRTLKMRRDGLNGQATHELAEKVCNLLQIENDMPAVKLLYIVLKDYEHLHS